MKNILILLLLFVASSALTAQVPSPAPPQDQSVALIGGRVHIGNGEVIEKGAVTFDEGKIVEVASADKLQSDISTANVIDTEGKEVYPGLIAPVSGLGLTEIGGVRATQDAQETGSLNPNVRSLIAYNTDSELIPTVRSNGILLAQITPDGGLITGTSSIVQLDAWNWEDAAYKADDAVHLGWPSMYQRRGYGSNRARTENTQYKTVVQQLDKLFADARAYQAGDAPEKMNLRLEAMEGLFTGEKQLFISAGYVKEIIEAIHFARKHQVRKIVLVSAAEDALLAVDLLKEHNIPVIVAHIHRLPGRKDEDVRIPFKLPARFIEEGLLVGLYYPGNWACMNLPFIAGHTVGYGLTREQALQCITLNNAKILGIDDRTGSLEAGKDANIIVSEGDILDIMTSNVTHAFIQGRQINLDNKHKQLYKQYKEKYSHESD